MHVVTVCKQHSCKKSHAHKEELPPCNQTPIINDAHLNTKLVLRSLLFDWLAVNLVTK